MSKKIDHNRRRALHITSGIMGAVTVGAFAVPFLSAWNPSEKAKALGAAVEKFDLSKLLPGSMAVIEWRRTPIFVVHQTDVTIKNLPKLNDRVTNPALSRGISRTSNQKYTIFEEVCTHLSCAPKYHPEIEPKAWDQEWLEDFSVHVMDQFDLAGRVYKGVPAQPNLGTHIVLMEEIT